MSLIRSFPWFEITLILGLATALIVKPQTRQLSASTPESSRIESRTILPIPTAAASTQPRR